MFNSMINAKVVLLSDKSSYSFYLRQGSPPPTLRVSAIALGRYGSTNPELYWWVS